MKTAITLSAFSLMALLSIAVNPSQAFGSASSPTLQISPSLRSELGHRVQAEDFSFHPQAKRSLQAKNAVYAKEYAGQPCPFAFEYSGPGATDALDLMAILTRESRYPVNEVRYFERGVVYIAWQAPAHTYQIPYPRLIVRIFDAKGKTTAFAFQNGFSDSELCQAK